MRDRLVRKELQATLKKAGIHFLCITISRMAPPGSARNDAMVGSWPRRWHGSGAGRGREALAAQNSGSGVNPTTMFPCDWWDVGGHQQALNASTARLRFICKDCDCEGICGSAAENPTAVVEARAPDQLRGPRGDPRVLKLPRTQLAGAYKRGTRRNHPSSRGAYWNQKG